MAAFEPAPASSTADVAKSATCEGFTATLAYTLTADERIQQAYCIPEPGAVQRFLDEHPFLIPLLLDAHPQILKYFPGSPVYLEVFADAEDSTWVQLIATIVPQVSPEEVLEREAQFEQAWWANAAPQAEGALEIMAAYR